IFPRLDTYRYFIDENYKFQISNLVKLGVGGFCLFGGNIEENIRLTNELQFQTDLPLLFCGDFENGIAMRLTEGTEFPHAYALGYLNSTNYTRQAAQAIAQEAKAIGAYWNLAPVADINSNPANPVIGIRSFGETPEKVSAHVKAYVEGTQAENVLACVKHFPGHGEVDIDSHLDLPIIMKTKQQLESFELLPFIAGFSSFVRSIMIGHLVVPSLDDSHTPASLSIKIISEFLRNELGYNGLVITDALDMNAIVKNYTEEQIAELAIKAGNDVLLMPENPEHIVQILAKLAKEDEEVKNRLLDSVARIISEKRWAKLIPEYHNPDLPLNLFTEHPTLALKIAFKSLEIIDIPELIPIKNISLMSVFAILQRPEDMEAASRFMKMLADAVDFDCDFSYVDKNITDEQVDKLLEQTADSDLFIFPIFFKSRAYNNSTNFPENLKNFIEIVSKGKNSIAILFGNPYLKDEISTKTKILAFSDSYSSMAAVVMKLSDRDLDWIGDE
ncbi:MAG TPA: glycoside hydrolase family 3 protein, partial [Candidatus Kapabacteria bacterium]|nr:glycoside hydrolase family 3 protein [Candidatus Kapabacteria bacterium]